MNKKIYFHGRFIGITENEIQPSGNQLFVNCSTSTDSIVKEKIEEFLQQNDLGDLILFTKNVDSLFEEIKRNFQYIEAAGGLIECKGKYVIIHRLGKWDLPKGKIDPGENAIQAAIRECQEECLVKDLSIVTELPSSYHIYPYKGKFALKKTFWYLMKSPELQNLIPQTEENIDQAVWMDKPQILQQVITDTYPAIMDVLKDGIFNK